MSFNFTASISVASTAAAFLAAMALTAPPAEAALVTFHFQKTVPLECAGGVCNAPIVKLTSNQALNVASIRCHFSVEGETVYAQANVLPSPPNFILPLEVLWERSAVLITSFTYGSDAPMRVPLGKELHVNNTYSGSTPSGFCTVIGELLVNQ